MNLTLKNGDLSVYGLACGYIQQRDIDHNVNVTLWQEGGPCYHVRAHDHNTGSRLFRHSTNSLAEARRVYKTLTCPIN